MGGYASKFRTRTVTTSPFKGRMQGGRRCLRQRRSDAGGRASRSRSTLCASRIYGQPSRPLSKQRPTRASQSRLVGRLGTFASGGEEAAFAAIRAAFTAARSYGPTVMIFTLSSWAAKRRYGGQHPRTADAHRSSQTKECVETEQQSSALLFFDRRIATTTGTLWDLTHAKQKANRKRRTICGAVAASPRALAMDNQAFPDRAQLLSRRARTATMSGGYFGAESGLPKGEKPLPSTKPARSS